MFFTMIFGEHSLLKLKVIAENQFEKHKKSSLVFEILEHFHILQKQ